MTTPTRRSVLAMAGGYKKGGEFLFTNPKTGTKYTTIKTGWLTDCRIAGLSNLRFHDLRHTFGTRAAVQVSRCRPSET